VKYRRGRALALGVVVAFVAAIVAATPASAKGPSQGVITGPGLAQPITLREPGSLTIGPALANVVMQSGFFVGTFGGTRHVRGDLAHQPAGTLGPRYTITYTMAVPDRPSSDIVQYVFPYAEPHPITYLPPNQKYWGNRETVGGWFAARVGLKQTLLRLGLPVTPLPAAFLRHRGDTGSSTGNVPGNPLAIPLWITAAMLIVVLASILTRKRWIRLWARA
jgi:hypothetical protein